MITFTAIGAFIPIVFKLGHLYCGILKPREYLFSTHKLAQVHCNLGHALAGSVYRAFRRAYRLGLAFPTLLNYRTSQKDAKTVKYTLRNPTGIIKSCHINVYSTTTLQWMLCSLPVRLSSMLFEA